MCHIIVSMKTNDQIDAQMQQIQRAEVAPVILDEREYASESHSSQSRQGSGALDVGAKIRLDNVSSIIENNIRATTNTQM